MRNKKAYIKYLILMIGILVPIGILIAVIIKPFRIDNRPSAYKPASASSEKMQESLPSSVGTEKVAPASDKIEIQDSYFRNFKEAAFLIEDGNGICLGEYNHAFLDKRISPLSTFKILNSLIFIKEGLIENQNSVVKWDKKTYQIESWNRDQTLKSAFQNSVVWVYHKLSQKVSKEKYTEYLTKAHYGNCDIKSDQTDFWLNASLKISLREQVAFLRNFHDNKLGFSDTTTAIVKDIMKCFQNDVYTIYGKTGTGQGTNLFVGYVEDSDKNVYYFATYLNNEGLKNEAKPITYMIISNMFKAKNKNK